MPMMLNIQVAKFIFSQYQQRPVSPNLMLAKLPAIQYIRLLSTLYHVMRFQGRCYIGMSWLNWQQDFSIWRAAILYHAYNIIYFVQQSIYIYVGMIYTDLISLATGTEYAPFRMSLRRKNDSHG